MGIKTERLDKLLSNLGYGSRKEVKSWVKHGLVTCNDKPLTSTSQKVDPHAVLLDGEPLDHPEGLTLIYHKPLGTVCSRKEEGRLIYDDLPEQWQYRKPPLSTVGRLDKETSGLLIITDDGQLNHHLTSPKHHISKTYAVTLDRPLQGNEAELFASGKLMLEDDDRPCLPAEMETVNEKQTILVLHEGRYHQVRRMFAAVGNHVTELTRTNIGSLSLDNTGLAAGECMVIEPEALIERVSPE
ncbi:MAG: pseudouridine synthase [Mariprofundaceae bacterium]